MTIPHAVCTIVIPCYNGEACLQEAVESVLAQSFPDFHLVLVDDASRDGTLALARRLAAGRPNVSVVALPVNRGRSFARNRGTEVTRGPYVAFLDQDDAYHPDFLRHTVSVLSQEPQLDAVKVLPEISIEIDPVRYRSVVGSLATTLLLRRPAFELLGGFPEGELFRRHPGGCEDIALQWLFSVVFNMVWLEEKLYRYRHRPGNALDRFLSLTAVVDGQMVFTQDVPEDRAFHEEVQRLRTLLRERVRGILREGQRPFTRLEEAA